METSFDRIEWIFTSFGCLLPTPAGDGRVADTVFHPVLTFLCPQLKENPVK